MSIDPSSIDTSMAYQCPKCRKRSFYCVTEGSFLGAACLECPAYTVHKMNCDEEGGQIMSRGLVLSKIMRLILKSGEAAFHE